MFDNTLCNTILQHEMAGIDVKSNGDKYFAAVTAKLRFGADLLPFRLSPLVNGSDAELKMLLLKHRVEINSEKGANLLMIVLVVVMLLVVVVVVVTLPMSMAMVFVIFGFRKNIARGS